MNRFKCPLAIGVMVSGIVASCIAAGVRDNRASAVDMSGVYVETPEVVARQKRGLHDLTDKGGSPFLVAKASKNDSDGVGAGDSVQQKEGPEEEKPAEEFYKNIQVFKGVPSKRILAIMGGFKMALGVDCTHCHIQDQWDKDDLKTKLIARKMVSMVMDINNRQLADIGKVSCYTCHRGEPHPLLAPPSK
jgi:hypothetical protein